jgi:autotransporter-associated beta strand protein
MKSKIRSKSNLFSAAAVLALCSTLANAGTITTTFTLQKDNLLQDGNAFGSGLTYAGVVDGTILDNSATSARTITATGTIGNQFQSTGTTNGRQTCGLFSYDLTELNAYIVANTGPFSSVTIQSVSFRLISASVGSGTSMSLGLYGTDPFTSAGSTWSNYTTGTPWTVPYQSGRAETAYNFTGGPSALTTALGGSSPGTGTNTTPIGTALTWTSSANFISTFSSALARPDKTLYLAARGTFFNNGDNRVSVNYSPAATVADRPRLTVVLDVTTTAAPATWTGASDNSWITAGNWSPSGVPATDAPITFNSSSTANLSTVLNQNFTVTSVTVSDPSGSVSIGGANTLNLGAGGVDLSAATQNLTVSTPVVMGAIQSWNVGTGRTLGVSGAVSGNFPLTIAGAGKVSLGASNILPNGASANNVIVSGTLDLNGTSQSVNALTGSGIVDNTAVGTATLTVGNNDASGTFSGILQDTGGALAVVKTGTGSLTLTGASDFSGGFTNNGAGIITPNNNLAFGVGPVVSNGSTLYATATTTFANALTLNGATLRIGGGGSKTITWNGPVTATGTSGLICDGGTGGITLSNTLDMTGATFSSFANGTTNTITGNISGVGGSLNVTLGTLNLTGTNTYDGATTVTAGTLRVNSPGSLSASSAVAINGTSSLGGSGTIGGSVTVATDANVAPGAASLVGTLAIGGGFNISAKASGIGKLSFQLDSLAGTSDKITVAGTLTIGVGALGFNDFTFTNVGGLQTGTYKLITSGGINGGDTLDAANLVGTIGVFVGTLQITGNDIELVVAPSGYDSWKTQITNGLNLRTDDADGDGFNNLQEFLFGTSPIAGNGSLVTTTASGGNLVLRWLQRETGATYTLVQSSTLAAGSWTTVTPEVPALDANQTGAPTDYDYFTVTLPTGSGKLFYRIQGVEN